MKLRNRFKVKISRKNSKKLEEQSELCRNLYNCALEHRIYAYKYHGKSVSGYDQRKELPEIKKENHEYKEVYNKYLSNTLLRLDTSFKNFFRRIKKGEKPGFPRFKSKDKFFSLEVEGPYCKRISDYKLQLPQKIIVTTLDKLPEKLSTIVIKKNKGSWFISIVIDFQEEPKKTYNGIVAYDLGIKTLAVGYNGKEHHKFEYLKVIRKFDKFIDDLKSQRDQCKKYSRKWISKNKGVKKLYKKITNKKLNHFHHISKKIAQGVENTIVVGDLSIREMISENKQKNREIFNRWSIYKFITLLSYKCKKYGKAFLKIDESYTTKECSNCSNRKTMKLSDRIYKCDSCGMSKDRDENSSINIYNRAFKILAPLGLSP